MHDISDSCTVTESIGTQLQSIKSLFVEKLMDRQAWASLHQLTTQLPSFSGSIIEYHLGSHPKKLDYSLRVKTLHNENKRLLKYLTTDNKVRKALAGPAARSFVSKWADSSSVLHRDVKTSWLEYDHLINDNKYSPPSLFVRMEEHLESGQRYRVLEEVLHTCNHAFDGEAVLSLKRWLNTIPKSMSFYYFGLMLGRADVRKLRVCLTGQKLEDATLYANECAIPTALLELAYAWQREINSKKFIWNFDCSPEPNPQYSIELFPSNPDEWSTVMQRLCEVGCCTIDEYNAIMAWEGAWPLYRSYDSRVSEKGKSKVTICVPNHIKLKLDEQGQLEAKVYLYFGQI